MSDAIELSADHVIDLADDAGVGSIGVARQYTGPDAFGAGLSVVTGVCKGTGTPRNEDLRKLHADRLGNRVFPLVVAIVGNGGAWLVGPGRDTAPVGPIEVSQAQRILQAGLDEPDGLSARQRVSGLLRSLEATDIPGLTNSGLFANHFLTTSAPHLDEWEEAKAAGTAVLGLRGDTLLSGLGYEIKRASSSAHFLSSPDSAETLSIAVVLKDEEAFEHASDRFAVSPVAYGLNLAATNGVPWLIALRGSQIRIYPAKPGVGVGSRGQADTFFELDLALLDTTCAGYLGLVFTADALEPDGLVNLLLDGSERFATSLGERLRDRVYEHAVPSLAVAVAKELERLGEPDLGLAYQLTLRILFRLLFQAYAEDGGLLPYGRNDRYTRNSLKKWAQDFVDEPSLAEGLDAESFSIWRDLQQVWEVIDTGNSTWEVPAYNGGLFGSDPEIHSHGALISQLKLSDATVGSAVYHLVVDSLEEGGVGAVDFRSLSVREFGTIYEGLLESELSRTDIDLTLNNKSAYVPTKDGDDVVVEAGQIYFHNKSGERKATGSYFTPSFAVEHLIDRALVPTLDEHLEKVVALLDADDEQGAYRAFFDFRVADLAMGSGHFLVAAIDQIEAQMAAFLSEHPIPGVTNELRRLEKAARDALGEDSANYEIEPASLLRRQIARRCVYGLDINPISVELARVGIWIHTFIPGLPMSSLEHNLVCANSLTGIGTVDEALDALEPDTGATGTVSLLRGQIEEALNEAKELLVKAADSAEATKAEVREAAEIAREAAAKAEDAKALFDAAVAARINLIDLADVYDVDTILKVAGTEEIRETIGSLNPGHMPYLFPEVFLRAGGGFDVVLGNPPWEKVMPKVDVFYSLRFPGLKSLSVSKMNEAIATIRSDRPDIAAAEMEEISRLEAFRAVLHAGPFPDLGKGHPDLYKAFMWRFLHLTRRTGRFGVVLPRSSVSAAGSSYWREQVFELEKSVDVAFLLNNRGWVFADVHPQFTFALVAVEASTQDSSRVSIRGPYANMDEFVAGMSNSPESLSVESILRGTSTAAFPLFGAKGDAGVFEAMLQSPPFDSSSHRWAAHPVQGDFNSTTGKKFMELDPVSTNNLWPVYSGMSFNLWRPDTGKYYAWARESVVVGELLSKRKKQALRKGSVAALLPLDTLLNEESLPCFSPRITYRKITNRTNRRTVIAALAPPRVIATTADPYLHFTQGDETDVAYVLGVMASMPFDWYARRFVEINLDFHYLNSFPVPNPKTDCEIRPRIVELSGRLAAVDDRFQEWAAAVGVPVGTLRDEPERSDAIYELDALVSLLYGLSWDQVEHVFETFHRGWDYSERLAAVKKHYDRWSDQV